MFGANYFGGNFFGAKFPTLVLAPPTVTTGTITSITSTSAVIAGNLANTSTVMRGVQYSTTPNPNNQLEEDGLFNAGNFTETLTNLFPGNVYYVRAYATNQFGTGYGNWVSFTTLADAYKIVIGGLDRTAEVLNNTLIIEDNITDKQTNCTFTMVDRTSRGIPINDTEIIITLDSGVRQFAGYTITANRHIRKGTYVEWDITCIDYTRDMDRNLVNKTYLNNQYDSAIIADVIANFTQGSGITGNHVVQGAQISMIAFNYIQFSKAMRKICDTTGRNWYIDYLKDIHYFPMTQNPAPFNITDSQKFSDGLGFWDLQMQDDNSQLKNRVYVRGGTYQSDTVTQNFAGDGVSTQFPLPDRPTAVTVLVNGIPKTLGKINTDIGKDWYLNSDSGYIQQDAAGVILQSTDTLTVSYTYAIPILVAVEDTTSIAAFGVQEFVIVDKSILTTQAARDRASAELADYAEGISTGDFYTYTPGFRSGQYVTINSTVLGITNITYLVQKVVATSIGGGKFTYHVYLANSQTMGVIRFLLELLENNKNLAEVSDNEVLDNLVSLSDSIDPNSLTDALTIDSAGPYRTWAKDSLEATITVAKWGLFEWK